VLLAGRGMGKSVFLRQLAAMLGRRDDLRVLLIPSPPAPLTVESMIEALADALGVESTRPRSTHGLIEHYLAHQAEKFCLQYDANSYLYISKAMDLFDLTEPRGEDGRTGMSQIQCPTLVVGVSTDVLFPVWQQRELRDLLQKGGCEVRYEEIDAPFGHDTFLIEHRRLGAMLSAHLAD